MISFDDRDPKVGHVIPLIQTVLAKHGEAARDVLAQFPAKIRHERGFTMWTEQRVYFGLWVPPGPGEAAAWSCMSVPRHPPAPGSVEEKRPGERAKTPLVS